MGSTNFGDQKIRFSYEEPATSLGFNQLFNNVIPTGLYATSATFTTLLSNTGSTQINVQPFTICIKDPIAINSAGDGKTGVTVIIETTTVAVVTVNVDNAHPFVVARLSWISSATNWMDIFCVAWSGTGDNQVKSSDVILGKTEWNGTTLIGFDYSQQTIADMQALIGRKKNFIVTQTQPGSNQVNVSEGTFVTNAGAISVSATTSPTISNTVNGRNDLIYLDYSGAVQVLLGTDSATPVTPAYNSLNVIAEIHRGASATVVNGSAIIQIHGKTDESYRGTQSAISQTLIRRDTSGRAQVVDPSASQDISTKNYVDNTAGTPSPTASLLIRRDSAARAQVANPSAAQDIATKTYVDNTTGTPLATASALVRRDASSRAQVADPAVSQDIATKNYVDNTAGTSSPTASLLIRRDASARAQVANPSAAQDIATKTYVDNTTGTSSATANLLIRRDSSSRAQVADPSTAQDIATKNYVDTQGVSAPTANTLVKRDASGRAQVVDPSASQDISTKNYVDTGAGTTTSVILSLVRRTSDGSVAGHTMLLDGLTSDPASPAAGQIWFRA